MDWYNSLNKASQIMIYNENMKKITKEQTHKVKRGSNSNEVNILKPTSARQIVQYGIYKLLMMTLHTSTIFLATPVLLA